MVNLGDRVEDKVTGFTGIVTSIVMYLNGCRRIAIQTKALKDGAPIAAQYFDEPQIIVLEKGAITLEENGDDGGPAYSIDPGRSTP